MRFILLALLPLFSCGYTKQKPPAVKSEVKGEYEPAINQGPIAGQFRVNGKCESQMEFYTGKDWECVSIGSFYGGAVVSSTATLEVMPKRKPRRAPPVQFKASGQFNADSAATWNDGDIRIKTTTSMVVKSVTIDGERIWPGKALYWDMTGQRCYVKELNGEWKPCVDDAVIILRGLHDRSVTEVPRQ